MVKTLAWILPAAVCGLAALAPAAAATPAERPNIILVVVDTLRADRLGAYGYFRPTTPHLDRLAAESVLFELLERCDAAEFKTVSKLLKKVPV